MDPTTESLFGSVGSTLDLSPSSLEDDLDESGILSDGDSNDQIDSSAGPKRRNRRLPSSAEKRATHNAVERARRESLNVRFMELARALPTMSANKRPSKNAIVSKSLDFVKTARAREQILESENARLRNEVNELRAKLGMQSIEACSKATNKAVVKPKIAVVQRQTPDTTRRSSIVASTPSQTTAQQNVPAPIVTTSGPYLAQDPLSSVTLFGFAEPLAANGAQSSLKVASSPAESSSSDSDSSSHVTTPLSSYSFDMPLMFDETLPSSQTLAFEQDLLAACGLQSSFPSAGNMSGWNNAALGLSMPFSTPSSFPLYA